MYIQENLSVNTPYNIARKEVYIDVLYKNIVSFITPSLLEWSLVKEIGVKKIAAFSLLACLHSYADTKICVLSGSLQPQNKVDANKVRYYVSKIAWEPTPSLHPSISKLHSYGHQSDPVFTKLVIKIMGFVTQLHAQVPEHTIILFTHGTIQSS